MTARDGKQLKVFIVLLVILSVVAFLSFRINQPSSASVTPPAPKDVADSRQSAASDTRIRLDLMKQDSGEEVGLNNLFQYHMGRSGGSADSSGTAAQTPLDPPPEFPPPVTPTPVPDPPRPALPPAPPPMQFRYDGFLKTPNGLLASISDSTGHYSLREGEFLHGRYRIAKVTEAIVEVEDLQIPRRQSFARAQ